MSPRITALQAAWLAEIGVDPQWLSRLAGSVTERAAESALASVVRPAVRSVAESVKETVARPTFGPTPVPPQPAAQSSSSADGPGGAGAAVPGRRAHAQDGRVPPPKMRAVAPDERVPAPEILAPRISDLQSLDEAIRVCRACDLHAQRTHAVPGSGCAQSPRYLIVGEMPGADDDVSGQPFEGQAGTLLRAMLAAVRLPDADSVYLTHVLKCRPAGGRAAQAAEVAACLPYLHRQIQLLRPQHILVLGRLAARALLGTRASLDELRGREHAYVLPDGSSIGVWVTHHPASLLLRPAWKAQAWADLLALVRVARAVDARVGLGGSANAGPQ